VSDAEIDRKLFCRNVLLHWPADLAASIRVVPRSGQRL